jgi:Flp pilus assembly protein TadG
LAALLDAKEGLPIRDDAVKNPLGGKMMNVISRLRKKTACIASSPRNVAASRYGRGFTRFAANNIFVRLCVRQEGSSVVETALVIVFIMTPLLLGIFSLCMALVAYQQLNYAVLTATQKVSAGRGIISDPCATIAASITAQLSSWNPNGFTYTVTITSTADGTNTVSTYGPYTGTALATCTGSATTSGNGNYSLTNAIGDANGNPISVNVSYTYNWFPLFGKNRSGTLKAEETMLVS